MINEEGKGKAFGMKLYLMLTSSSIPRQGSRVLGFVRNLPLLCKLLLSLAVIASRQCRSIDFPLRIGYEGDEWFAWQGKVLCKT